MRAALEKTFRTHDGTQLYYRHWPAAAAPSPRRAVVLFHRGHEHSGRLQHVVDELALPECDMFAWDARGHGRSPGVRGDSPSFGASVKDVDRFVRHIEREHGIAPEHIAIVAQSMAAVLVATWVHDYAPRVCCLVLTAPAFSVKLYVPFARPGLKLLQRLRGNFFIQSYVKPRLLTHDPERIRSYERDPLVTRAISVRVLLGLLDAADRIVADAQAIRVPVQLLVSDTDWVVRRAPQERFFHRLGSEVKEMHLLHGFLHDTLGESNRRIALGLVRDFVQRRFDDAREPASLYLSDQQGYSYEEEQALRKPLPAWSPRNLEFALTRWSMRTLGRLSCGIRLGLETGFDSGASLDYVYANEARGALLLGKLIDRNYLDAIGWRGVRLRRQHLGQAMALGAQRLAEDELPLRIVDLAAGPGRYLLDLIQELSLHPESVVLRDYDAGNVAAGQGLIDRRGWEQTVRFEQGDAFDSRSVASIAPAPTMAIVSGLFELFPENERVQRTLDALGRAIVPGGFLVYTGQPWHPQLELIARTLVSHRDRQPWIMRRRSQAELDELVASAGFGKVEQWIDEWGMFTVSLAQRPRTP